MANRTVTSPAGKRIRIYPDDEWLEMTGLPNDWGLRQWTGLKPMLIRSLWERGPVQDKQSGRATHHLSERIRALYPESETFTEQGSVTSLLRHDLNAPAFQRKTNGKRTYEIELVALPERWYTKLKRHIAENPTAKEQPKDEPQVAHSEPESEPIPEIVPELPSAVLLEPTAPILDVSMASQVAMELLTQVVGIIAKGDSTQADAAVMRLNRDLDTVQARLSERLAENTTLRKRLADAGERITALQVERNGLQQKLRATEANLTAALNGDSLAAVNDTIAKAINGIMRAPATTKGET